jgi:hypothetical protein
MQAVWLPVGLRALSSVTLNAMSIEPEAILRDALALPSRARAVVAAELLASLDEPDADDAEAVAAAWAQELEQRARRALSGEDPGESWALVRDRLRDSLAR